MEYNPKREDHLEGVLGHEPKSVEEERHNIEALEKMYETQETNNGGNGHLLTEQIRRLHYPIKK